MPPAVRRFFASLISAINTVSPPPLLFCPEIPLKQMRHANWITRAAIFLKYGTRIAEADQFSTRTGICAAPQIPVN